MADVVAGSSVLSYGKSCVTQSADVHYVRPAMAGETLQAVGQVLHCGKTTGISEVTITDRAGKLICKATVTMHITGHPVRFPLELPAEDQ